MPERTPLGKKAIEFLNARDAVDRAEHERDKIKEELILEFVRAGMNTIKVSGYTIAYLHFEKDTVTAKEA